MVQLNYFQICISKILDPSAKLFFPCVHFNCFVYKDLYVPLMCYSEGKRFPADYALRESTLRSFAVRTFVQADS